MTKTQRQALMRLLDEVKKTKGFINSEVRLCNLNEAVMDVRMAFKLLEVRPSNEVQLTLFSLEGEGHGQETS